MTVLLLNNKNYSLFGQNNFGSVFAVYPFKQLCSLE